MAYHETFWLAVATAAPIIALANAVSITDVVGLWLKVKIPRRSIVSGLIYFVVITLSASSLLLQIIALFMALKSLYMGENIGDGTTAAALILAGLTYVLIIVIFNAILRYTLRRGEAKEEHAESMRKQE